MPKKKPKEEKVQGWSEKELQAFLAGTNNVENTQRMIIRRLRNRDFEHKWPMYEVKLAQLEKVAEMQPQLKAIAAGEEVEVA